jgi:glycosyl transferase family 25
MVDIKTYVVNLDKSVERLSRITHQLNELGMTFVRVPAVYGASLSKQERKRDFALFHSMLAMRRKLLDGEIGCALSHDKIYRRMKSDGIEIALVLEDDVIVSPIIKDVLAMVEEFVDKQKPQVFILSCYDNGRCQKTAIEPIHNATCTDGYVITLPAARAIFDVNYPVVTVADSWHRWEKRLGLQIYQCIPAPVRQYCLGEFHSVIQGEAKGTKAIGVSARDAAHKLKEFLCRLKV